MPNYSSASVLLYNTEKGVNLMRVYIDFKLVIRPKKRDKQSNLPLARRLPIVEPPIPRPTPPKTSRIY